VQGSAGTVPATLEDGVIMPMHDACPPHPVPYRASVVHARVAAV